MTNDGQTNKRKIIEITASYLTTDGVKQRLASPVGP
jgi:hypothetical protein